MRGLILSVVVGGAMGCGGGTSLSIDVTFATALQGVEGAVYGDNGVIRDHRPLGSQPGKLVILLPNRDQRVRVVIHGQAASALAFGVVDMSLRAGDNLHATMVVATGVADGDGDGVPDLVDDCPTVADPTQANARGIGPGDACFAAGDLGGLDLSGGAGPDLAGADLAGDMATTVLVGRTSVGGNVDYMDKTICTAYRVTASDTGTATHFSFLVDASTTATSAMFGVYTNNGAMPGTLLGVTPTTSVAIGWTTATLQPVSITSGTDYWLAIAVPASDNGTLDFRNDCGLARNDEAIINSSTLPSTWPAGALNPCGNVSAYLTP